MYKKRKQYARDFKLEAVRLSEEGDRTVASVARDLGINVSMLHSWRKKFLEHEQDPFPGKGHLHPKDEEIRQLRRQLTDVTEERDILKKAIAVFSKHPR
jgi:transposase